MSEDITSNFKLWMENTDFPEVRPGTISKQDWMDNYKFVVVVSPDQRQIKAESWEEFIYALVYFEKEGLKYDQLKIYRQLLKLKGLATYESLVSEFQAAQEKYIELKSFPEFSKKAKIRPHDSVIVAGDTGSGKSSLAINFINDLNDEYPVLYVNLEMDNLTILQRLVAIRTGLELDRIEGYQNDTHTQETVNAALKGITSRMPLQIVRNIDYLEDIEEIIKRSTEGREDPTVVVIDHALLIRIRGKDTGRYDRFTIISERLRKMALKYNVIMFVVMQQNRSGKADGDEIKKPTNSSLKESGSWENDSTHVCFLWYDPGTRKKWLLMTKHRGGELGEFMLDYYPKSQTYLETKTPTEGKKEVKTKGKQTARDKRKERLTRAYEDATINTGGNPTLHDMAEAVGVNVSTIKGWVKEFGGFTIDGVQIDPAGVEESVEYTGFVKLTMNDEQEVNIIF